VPVEELAELTGSNFAGKLDERTMLPMDIP
jgi:hypothetical protein